MTQLPESYTMLLEKYKELLETNKALSDAYVRLRTKIPGALLTKYGPSSEDIYELTEKCLVAVLEELVHTRVVNEKLEAKVVEMRKIVL